MPGPIAILFANLKGNIGDFAILEATILDINRRFPGCPIDYYSHAHLAVDPVRFEAWKREFGPIGSEITYRGTLGQRDSSLLSRGLSGFASGRALQKKVIEGFGSSIERNHKDLSDAKEIIFMGGEQWAGLRVGASMFGTLRGLGNMGLTPEAYPFSVSRHVFRDNDARDLGESFRLLKSPLRARDALTRDLLQNVGAPAELVPDIVFSLRGLAKTVEPALERDTNRITLCITGKKHKLEGDLAGMVRRLHGRPCELLTTSAPEDFSAMTRVAQVAKIPFCAPNSWKEAVSEFKSSEVIIANRLHGLILGALAGAAVLPLTDRSKTKGFARDSGIPVVAAGTAEITMDLVEEAISRKSEIRSALSEYLDSQDLRAAELRAKYGW